MKSQDIEKRSTQVSKSILEALKLMDSSKTKLLFVFDENKFAGLLTIGDVQRAILKDVDLTAQISSILSKNKVYASIDEPVEVIKEKISKMRAECMPVLDEKGNLVKVYSWHDLFGSKAQTEYPSLDIPVVIMAGGMGSRLAPLTNIYPKPLIPIGEQTSRPAPSWQREWPAAFYP